MSAIYLIRHAEKPEGKLQGVDENGKDDPESLIPRGWQRAGALAVFFGSPAGLPSPARIYAAAPGKDKVAPHEKVGSKSRRPLETVTPLAAKLGLTPIETWTKGQETQLAAAITPLEGITLVCWQHEAIPAIATAITGSAKGIPDPWPGDRFDVVWRFVRSGADKSWVFDQVCQHVLAGDGTKPIG